MDAPLETPTISALFVFILVAGIVMNLFFLAIVLTVSKSSAGTKLLLYVHGTELVLISSTVWPYVATLSRGGPLTDEECVLPSALFHATSLLEPMSIALMAIVRWRLLSESAVKGDDSVVTENIAKWIALCTLLLLLVLTIDLGSAYGSGAMPTWGPFYLCVQDSPVYQAGVCAVFFGAAPFVVIYTRKLVQFIGEHGHDLRDKGKKMNEVVRVLIALTVSYYVCHVPWFSALFTFWFIMPVSLPIYRSLLCVYFLHASFSPLISLTMIKR